MRFQVDHRFPAAPAAVAALMVDAEFQQRVELPDLALPTVVAHARSGEGARLVLRYEYVGSLDPIARRVIGKRKLTWLQTLELDVSNGRGRLSIVAEADPDRLHAEATVALSADGLAATVRSIAGDFSVEVPLVGGTAERRILPGVIRRLDVEAAAVAAQLGGAA